MEWTENSVGVTEIPCFGLEAVREGGVGRVKGRPGAQQYWEEGAA